MDDHTPDFSLEVQGVEGHCSAGEAYAPPNSVEVGLGTATTRLSMRADGP